VFGESSADEEEERKREWRKMREFSIFCVLLLVQPVVKNKQRDSGILCGALGS